MKKRISLLICVILSGMYLHSQNTPEKTQYDKLKENVKNSVVPTKVEYNKKFVTVSSSHESNNNSYIQETDKDSINSFSKINVDTIIRIDLRKIACKIKNVNRLYVEYSQGESPQVTQLERKEVHKIKYNDGQTEEFNRPVIETLATYDWRTVLITDNKGDVDGLYERGKIEAKSIPEALDMRAAKADVTVKVKKKAANMQGIIVLVTKRISQGGYGEIPLYYIEGIVYGTEPLQVTSNNTVAK